MNKSTPTQELGYPRLEALIESENFERTNSAFSKAHKDLEFILNEPKENVKRKKGAQVAMQALENTVKLINELLVIKYKLIKEAKSTKK